MKNLGRIVLMLILLFSACFAFNKCNSRLFAQKKKQPRIIKIDTIPCINSNIETLILGEKSYIVYAGSYREIVSVSKTIADYMIKCKENDCDCYLGIVIKDGIASRVIKYRHSKITPLKFRIHEVHN